MRVSAFDLGTKGAVFRAERLEDGTLVPLSCERWSMPSNKGDEERYRLLRIMAECEVEWADATGYEHVQFNRGKSLIEGFRGILIGEAEIRERYCAGVNVSTLKAYAVNGRWSDADRKKRDKKPIDGKRKMAMALTLDHPDFMDFIQDRYLKGKLDDIIDAAWVAIWLLENIKVV